MCAVSGINPGWRMNDSIVHALLSSFAQELSGMFSRAMPTTSYQQGDLEFATHEVDPQTLSMCPTMECTPVNTKSADAFR